MEVYLTLFNGHPFGPRDGQDASAIPDRTFGPFTHVHGDSQGHLVCHTPDGGSQTFYFVDTKLFYDDANFGDWLVFSGRPEVVTVFDSAKAQPQRRAGERFAFGRRQS